MGKIARVLDTGLWIAVGCMWLRGSLFSPNPFFMTAAIGIVVLMNTAGCLGGRRIWSLTSRILGMLIISLALMDLVFADRDWFGGIIPWLAWEVLLLVLGIWSLCLPSLLWELHRRSQSDGREVELEKEGHEDQV